MFIAIARPAVEPQGLDAVALPGSSVASSSSPRALHARLLQNAALRRLRGVARRDEHRPDDAAYWLHAAAIAVNRAAALRRAEAGPITLP